jgi:4-aminobutyrate aminotransferase / (S)-3-amino-2-methylpropionate transaminase / 5-aminovalerate transaminase
MDTNEPLADAIQAERARYVSSSVTTPGIVITGAKGARLQGADGVSYIDFAGGIGCQNIGHGAPRVLAAIHRQVDRFLHQCFMVAAYEPYVDVCRRLSQCSPCAGADQKSVLFNSGAEAVENAVKVARFATGRPAVISFRGGFHGRTLLALSLTSKVEPYKRGFGPFVENVYCAAAPYEYRGVSSDAAITAFEALIHSQVEPASVAAIVLEPVQGEGGFIPMPADFPARLHELCRAHGILYVDDEIQAGIGRTGPVWAIEHYGVAPDLMVCGKSLGGGLPLSSLTGRAELMDAAPPGALGGTFGGNPVACAAAAVVLETVSGAEFRRQADALGEHLRARLNAIAAGVGCVGDVRGLGPMLALELVRDRVSHDPAPELARETVARARANGLVLLTCGEYGNVIRLLPPITIGEGDLTEGLDLLERALNDAAQATNP